MRSWKRCFMGEQISTTACGELSLEQNFPEGTTACGEPVIEQRKSVWREEEQGGTTAHCPAHPPLPWAAGHGAEGMECSLRQGLEKEVWSRPQPGKGSGKGAFLMCFQFHFPKLSLFYPAQQLLNNLPVSTLTH